MSSHYVLCRARRDGFLRVADIRLRADGTVEVSILEASAFTNSLAGGVASARLGRIVSPSEGRLFIGTLMEELERSSYWSVLTQDRYLESSHLSEPAT